MGVVTRSFISLSVIILVLGSSHRHFYGGRQHVSTNNAEVKAITNWAAHKLGGKSVSVLQAEEQIVSGMMYYIKFIMRKNDKVYTCRIKVWEQVWLHHRQLMKYHCKRSRGIIFGSHTWGQ